MSTMLIPKALIPSDFRANRQFDSPEPSICYATSCGRVLIPVTAPTALPGEEAGGTTLGPAVGTTVPTYLAQAAQGLIAAAKSSPDVPRTALVSFTAYQTPAQVEAMLSGYPALRVYLRARAGGKEAAQLPVDVRTKMDIPMEIGWKFGELPVKAAINGAPITPSPFKSW